MAEKDQKIPTDLGQNIQSFDAHKLKHADTEEKNALPSKEGSKCLCVLFP